MDTADIANLEGRLMAIEVTLNAIIEADPRRDNLKATLLKALLGDAAKTLLQNAPDGIESGYRQSLRTIVPDAH